MILTKKGIPEDLKTVFTPAVELFVVLMIWTVTTQKKLITNIFISYL